MATTVISSDQARARWREVMDTAVAGNNVVIERYGKPVAVLIPYEDYALISNLRAKVREPQADYQIDEREALKAELIAQIKAELLAESRETWVANWQQLRQQVAERGGLMAGLSKEDIVARLRQTRAEIFAAEYDHLY